MSGRIRSKKDKTAVASFFSGEFHHQLDEKMRIRIPAKLKELLGEAPFITRGTEGQLLVIPSAEANAMMERSFGEVTIADVDQHMSLRMFFSGGFIAEEDKQGRVTLPVNLIRYAAIQKNIVTVGNFKFVEIWSEERYQKKMDVSDEEYQKNLMLLSGRKKTDK